MAYNVEAANIVLSRALVYLAEPGTALPAPSVPAEGAWPAGWEGVGYTLQPTKLTNQFDVHETMVEQSYTPVKRRRTKETISVETVLAEFTAGNLKIVMDAMSTTHAAAGLLPAYEDVEGGGEPNLSHFAVGIEGDYAGADGETYPVRLFVYDGTVSGGTTIEMGKDNEAGLTLKIDALVDSTKPRGKRLYRIQRITGPAV